MPTVTRDDLLGELRDHAAGAARGAGRVVVLAGEAGIGKTTLARQLAHVSLTPVLWGSCEPLAASPPLLPLRDWARQDESLAAAVRGTERSYDLFAAALDALARPTLAVVEDVHWADDATLDLLVYLGRRLADLPSLLLVTTRHHEPVRPARVDEVLRRLAAIAGNAVLEVPPLTVPEVAALAGGAHDAERLRDLTGGNAFFVTEVVGNPTEGVPTSVREAVLARAALLGDDARAVLETVAVIPDRAEIDVVYAAAQATVADLEQCERAGLLTGDGATVAFRHELARDAVETSLPGSRRRERHRSVLDALLREPAGRDGQIAYQADAAGAHDEAVAYGLLAARASAAAGAHHQAATQLERARTHLAHARPDDRLPVLAMLAEEYQLSGPLDRAVAVAEEAVTAAEGDPSAQAQALAMLSRSRWLAGDGARAGRDIAEAVRVGALAPQSAGNLAALTQASRVQMLVRDFDECLRTGGAAIALAEERGDERMRVRAVNAVGTASVMTGRPDGVALMEDGLDRALRMGDDDNAGLIMVNLGSGLGEVRAYDEALVWLERCVVFCQERDSDLSRDYARSWQARIHLERGDWAAAQVVAESLADSPSQLAQMGALLVRGRLAVRHGQPGSAELREAYRRALAIGEVQRTWPAAAGLAESAYLAGDPLPDEVLPTFEDAVAHTAPWGAGELGWHLVRASVLSPDDPRVAAVPGPYAAQIAGDWHRAALLWDELGCRYDAALARLSTDDPHEMALAIAALDELGARSDADRGAARLRELGGVVPRRASRSTAANPYGLTAREGEVLRLLAEGLTNAEIAERAFISVKTAGHHVSAILAKLGVTTRREAAEVQARLRSEEI